LVSKRASARSTADPVAVEFNDDVIPALSERLGHAFSDPTLLIAALTHPSLRGHVRGRRADDFERLEFLGDRVLSLVVADWLFTRFPHEPEGDLARRHAELVSRDQLARVATTMGLDRVLRLSKSEANTGGAGKAGILADAFEAVLGAMFRDAGLTPTRQLIEREFAAALDAAIAPPRDAKTLLQEWTQGRALGLPTYRTVTHTGPAHRPHFVVEVQVSGQEPARGEGASKRAAEQKAAEMLLGRLPGGRL
jgi:ribonuclease III